jgi:hypothetical protein
VILPPNPKLSRPVTDGIRVNIREDHGSGSSGRCGNLFTIFTSMKDGIRADFGLS